MMAPRNTLIVCAALVLVPASLLAALGAVPPPAALAMAVVLLMLVLADAALGRHALDQISASFAETVRLAKGREGALRLALQHPEETRKRLRVGVAFPPEVFSPLDGMDVLISGVAGSSHLVWPCTGLKRGCYTLRNVYLETSSPLGLWTIRKTAPARGEIRVYPNMLHEQRNLAGIFLNRGMFGVHAHRQVGKGREFEKLREYIPGDGFEDIHWKATAKRGHPVTKVFQIERTQEVYVIIDASRLSARTVDVTGPLGGMDKPSLAAAKACLSMAHQTTTQLERFITAAMVLGLVGEKQGDLFGVVAFDDRVRAFVRAKNGKAHYAACRDALYTLEPRLVNPDFGEIASFLRLRLRRRALLIFLTNLDDPVIAESFMVNLDLLARHHLVLVNMLNLPGVRPLFSKDGVAGADDLYQHLAGHLQWRKLRELETAMRRRGVALGVLDNERLCPELVAQYINVKRRQVL